MEGKAFSGNYLSVAMSVYGKNPDTWEVVIPKPELLNMWYRIERKQRFKRCPRLNLRHKYSIPRSTSQPRCREHVCLSTLL